MYFLNKIINIFKKSKQKEYYYMDDDIESQIKKFTIKITFNPIIKDNNISFSYSYYCDACNKKCKSEIYRYMDCSFCSNFCRNNYISLIKNV